MKSSSRLVLIAVAAVILLVFPALVTYYTDWLWFVQVGYRGVFVRQLVAQGTLGLAVGAGAFALLAINLRVTLALLAQPYLMLGTLQDGRPLVLDRRQLRRLALAAAAFVAIVLGLSASASWLQVLEYFHQTSFGQVDPILGRDVAFYVFTLPVLDLARGLLLIVVMLSLIAAAGTYVVSGGVSFDPRTGLNALPRARLHLSLLVAALFLLMAAGWYLDIPRLLITQSGIIQGASYTDVYARLPFLRAGIVVLLLGAVLSAYHGFVAKTWPLVTAAALTLLVWTGGSLYATGIQRFVVAPNEQQKEIPFIEHNIEATRRAFALDKVEERELSGAASLTKADIENNGATLDNVRLWDHQPLLDTFGQIQEIRTYYDFVSVDNDRYTIDGKYRQIMLSARELNSDSLPNRTWVNERLTFTHGYGLTLGPVNQVTRDGLPVLFIKDLPPVSSVDLNVTQPSIYFGELSNDYVLVGTTAKEFHYPRGDDNVYSTYDGTDGVPIGSFWRRLLFGLRFRSTDIFLTEQITPQSRILFHRRLQDRIRTIAPFLSYDSDPYLVISDGRLFWMQDAYTTTNQYPYSSPATADGVTYIRNSVKVVVDAYNGTTTFYLADPHDPLALTLGQVFPGLLKPLDQMPAGLRAHIRYPEDIFTLQTAMYLDVPHDQPRGLLQQGGPVGRAGDRHRQPAVADAAVLHDHEPAERDQGGVHRDAALHAAAQGQPRRVDGGAQRRRALRAAGGVSVPEADAGVRPAPDRGADQPGPDDLAAGHALEPAGLAGHLGHAARDPDRGVTHLRPPAVPQGALRPHPRAEARHRRLPEHDRDGGHPAAGARPDLRRRRGAAGSRGRPGRRPTAASGGGPAARRRPRGRGARRPGARPLPARPPGPARRQLGALRRRDQAAWRRAGADGEASLKDRGPRSKTWATPSHRLTTGT